MAISASLIAKGIAGTLTLAAPVATSVYYKDSIYGLFAPEKTNTDPNRSENDNLNISPGDSNEKINITYSNGESCSITLTGGNASANRSTIIEELKKKLGETGSSKEDHRRYRDGLIEKCKAGSNSLSLEANSSENIDLSNLFDLNKQSLSKEEESSLNSGAWTISGEISSDKTKITITVANSSLGTDSTIGTCKVIGSHKSGTTSDLTDSKDEIVSSIKTKIEEKNTENKKNFFTKCKQSFNNEIKLELESKTDDSNKYQLKDLSSIFATNQKNSN